MNSSLLFEIKSKEINVSLSLFQNKWNVIYSKTFPLTVIEVGDEELVSLEWVKDMKQEISNIVDFNTIENISTLLNNNKLNLKSHLIKCPIEKNISDLKKEIKEDFSKNNKNLILLGVSFNKVVEDEKEKTIFYSCETIDKNFLKKIHSSFLEHDIKITNYIPLNKAIKNGITNYLKDVSSTFFIEIDDEQMIMSYFKNRQSIYQIKKSQGLNIVYSNISNKMGITEKMAKQLFDSFGYIPPEGIKEEDNKIVHTRNDEITGETISFDKKDLSSYITEAMNGIFKLIYDEIDGHKKQNLDLIFSGKIINLNGFIDYSKISLGVDKVSTIEKTLIGLKTNSILTIKGALKFLENKNAKSSNKQELKINIKKRGFVNYIKEKFIRA